MSRKLTREQLDALLVAAVNAGNLGQINYRRDCDAFAFDVLQNTTAKLTKGQRAQLSDYAKFML